MLKRCDCLAHVINLHISLSLWCFARLCLLSSLLFPHGHCNWSAVSDIFSDLCRPGIAGLAHSDPHRSWAQPVRPDDHRRSWRDAHQVSRPVQFDGSVFPQCLNPLFRRFLEVKLLFRKKSQKAWLGKPRASRECGETDGSVISVGESMSRKSRRNSTRSHSRRTQRKFYSGERDFREHLERRARQANHGDNSVQSKFYSTVSNMEIQNSQLRTKKFRICITWVTKRAWISETTIV